MKHEDGCTDSYDAGYRKALEDVLALRWCEHTPGSTWSGGCAGFAANPDSPDWLSMEDLEDLFEMRCECGQRVYVWSKADNGFVLIGACHGCGKSGAKVKPWRHCARAQEKTKQVLRARAIVLYFSG